MAYMFVVVIPVNAHRSKDIQPGSTGTPTISTSESETLEDTLSQVLSILKVDADSWQKSHDQKTWQVTFLVDQDESDQVLQHLFTLGIGNTPHSSVSLFWSNFHKGAVREHSMLQERECGNQESTLQGKEAERSEFIKSVKARLTVAQVVEAVKLKSHFTFDYIVFLLISSIISVVGFVESSPVYTVVSILVSPLMGPILAALFGTVIRVWSLAKLGLKNEGISLLICLCTGLVMGLAVSGANHDGVMWGGGGSWPTSMMKERGLLGGLWVSLLVSIPSGAGVALALLGGSISPLVGVAVSASLLGPVVNAGLLFGCSIFSAFSHPHLLEQQNKTSNPFDMLDCPLLKNNSYTFEYNCNMAIECLCLGLASLLHTVLDIAFVFVTGYIVLKIKEVAPHTSKSNNFEMFWKKDIQIARKSFKNTNGQIVETDDVTRQIEKEEKAKRISVLPEVLLDIESDPDYSTITRSLQDRPARVTSMIRNRASRITRTSVFLDQSMTQSRPYSVCPEHLGLEVIMDESV